MPLFFSNDVFIFRAPSSTHDNVITRLLIFQSQGVGLAEAAKLPGSADYGPKGRDVSHTVQYNKVL